MKGWGNNGSGMIAYLYRVMLSHIRSRYASWDKIGRPTDSATHPDAMQGLYNSITSPPTPSPQKKTTAKTAHPMPFFRNNGDDDDEADDDSDIDDEDLTTIWRQFDYNTMEAQALMSDGSVRCLFCSPNHFNDSLSQIKKIQNVNFDVYKILLAAFAHR